LPPLYATTEEGANFQRSRAREQLSELIAKQVSDAIDKNLEKPEFYPERQALAAIKPTEVLSQISLLLEDYAPNFEQSS
jgi:N-acetylmuramoyl-L-alanine amidase